MKPVNPFNPKYFPKMNDMTKKEHDEFIHNLLPDYHSWKDAAEHAEEIVSEYWNEKEDPEEFFFQLEQETKRLWMKAGEKEFLDEMHEEKMKEIQKQEMNCI